MIRRKEYFLETPEAEPGTISLGKELEYHLQCAVLLALLQRKELTQWQYEECIRQLRKIYRIA